MRRVVAAERTLAQTSQQISERLVTKKVQTLFSDFKLDVARQRLGNFRRATSSRVAGRCGCGRFFAEVSDNLLQPAARSTD